jgi:hypothetical protein
MNRSCSRFFHLGLLFSLLITFPNRTWGAEPKVQIRCLKRGSSEKRQSSRSKGLSAFGSGPLEGHSFCGRGTQTWGPDVLRFIESHLK